MQTSSTALGLDIRSGVASAEWATTVTLLLNLLNLFSLLSRIRRIQQLQKRRSCLLARFLAARRVAFANASRLAVPSARAAVPFRAPL